MATAYLIPLKAANQTQQIMLAGSLYTLTVRWNDMNQSWMFDLADSSGNALVSGIPIVTGRDLLAPFAHLGIGGQLVAQTTNDTDAVPTFENLGSSGNLYYVVS